MYQLSCVVGAYVAVHGKHVLVKFMTNLSAQTPIFIHFVEVHIHSGIAGGGAKRALTPLFSRENVTRVLCTMINYSQNKLLLTFLSEICC